MSMFIKFNLSTILLFISLFAYAQIDFEPGYFISNDGERVDCLIKNLDWKLNPHQFSYILEEGTESKTLTIADVQFFEISNKCKYVAQEVELDMSQDNSSKLNHHRKPDLEKMKLFLKVIIEGSANLYSYEALGVRKYFLKNETSDITYLVYKRYIVDNSILKTNNDFRQTLLTQLPCETNDARRVKLVDYNKGSLLKFFKETNECLGSEYVTYENKSSAKFFYLTVTAGLNRTKLEVNNKLHENGFEARTTNHLRLGIESEFILPFNKNKWSITFEPNFSSYESDGTYTSSNNYEYRVNCKYSALELPLGLRYHMFLKNESKLFLNAIGSYSIILKGKFKSEDSNIVNLDLNPKPVYGFGFGYKWKSKYSCELRTQMEKNALYKYSFWDDSFTTSSIILGYTF